jgi:hypothetical protein
MRLIWSTPKARQEAQVAAAAEIAASAEPGDPPLRPVRPHPHAKERIDLAVSALIAISAKNVEAGKGPASPFTRMEAARMLFLRYRYRYSDLATVEDRVTERKTA